MRRPSTHLALVWSFVAALSAPGLAVAHGEAHHHRAETEHARAHELAHDAGHDTSHDVAHEHPALLGDEQHNDHDHPELTAPVSAGRVDLSAAVIAATVSVPLADIATVRVAPISTRVSVRDGPPPDSPRQPRAPPLG